MNRSRQALRMLFFRLPDWLHEELSRLAAERGVSMSSLCRAALEEHIAKETTRADE